MGSHETFARRNDPLLVKTADGCPLPLRRFGPPDDGVPAVLLIAGGDGAMCWWRALVPALCLDEHERRIFAPLAPPQPFDATLQLVVWDGRGGGLFERPVHLVGHGMGGVTAALSAVDQPERVASLTLVAAPLQSEGVAVGDLSLATPAAVGRALSPAWVADHEEAVAALLREAEIGVAWATRLAGDDRRTEPPGRAAPSVGPPDGVPGLPDGVPGLVADMATLDRPLLVVHGRHDAVVPPERSRVLARRVGSAARLVELDAGHLVPVERAPELAAAVLAHVAAAEGG